MLSAFDMNKYYLSQKVLCEIYVWKFQTKFVLGEFNVYPLAHVNALFTRISRGTIGCNIDTLSKFARFNMEN